MPSELNVGKLSQQIVKVYSYLTSNEQLRRGGYSAGMFTEKAGADTGTHIHILARGVAGHHTVFRALILRPDRVVLTTGGRNNFQEFSVLPQP